MDWSNAPLTDCDGCGHWPCPCLFFCAGGDDPGRWLCRACADARPPAGPPEPGIHPADVYGTHV